ncbi:MAG: hypothetical protein L6R41_001310 [Letrouitia leprolyta]|nr:MAG: hypothetical protein L6R41_001310 [Letrouitia leprolyta]
MSFMKRNYFADVDLYGGIPMFDDNLCPQLEVSPTPCIDPRLLEQSTTIFSSPRNWDSEYFSLSPEVNTSMSSLSKWVDTNNYNGLLGLPIINTGATALPTPSNRGIDFSVAPKASTGRPPLPAKAAKTAASRRRKAPAKPLAATKPSPIAKRGRGRPPKSANPSPEDGFVNKTVDTAHAQYSAAGLRTEKYQALKTHGRQGFRSHERQLQGLVRKKGESDKEWKKRNGN